VALPLKERSAVTEVHVAWRRDEQARTTLDFVRFTRDAFGNKESFIPGQNTGRSPAAGKKSLPFRSESGRTRKNPHERP
jgi:hypothetical protein